MPPLKIESTPISLSDKEEFDLVPDEEHHHILEREPKFDINLKNIIEDIRSVDYRKILWYDFIMLSIIHVCSIYGLYLSFTQAMWTTVIFSNLLHLFSGCGITIGAHRLWAHRAFKAALPLRLILAFAQTMAVQRSIYDWVCTHRIHHKYSDTMADPHNSNRGFFFCHIGWIVYEKHPEVVKKAQNLDFSDLLEDPIIRFQHKYYEPLGYFICFFIPAFIPWVWWGENFWTAFFVAGCQRFVLCLHLTLMINSVAHWIGSKPFDKNIYPVQSRILCILSFGEGWHNFHHVFPFDYRSEELGFFCLNFSTFMINLFAKIGWAYDLKTASPSMVEQRAGRTGDGSYKIKSQ